MIKNIEVPAEQIAEFCRKHRIRKLSLFGSVLRNDFRPDSDIDVLVEFYPDANIGFVKLARMQDELSTIFKKRRIDLITAKFLNWRIRDQVLAEAQVQYVEKG